MHAVTTDMADITRNASISQHIHELEGTLGVLGEKVICGGVSGASGGKPLVCLELDRMDQIRDCSAQLVYVGIGRTTTSQFTFINVS